MVIINCIFHNKISEYKDKDMVTENALTDMRSKVELLTTTLDKEMDIKKNLENQVGQIWS